MRSFHLFFLLLMLNLTLTGLFSRAYGQSPTEETPLSLQAGNDWYAAGIRFETILSLPILRSGNCYRQFEDFIACVEGINSLLSKVQNRMILFPALLKDDPRIGRKVYEFGPLHVHLLIEDTTRNLSLREHYLITQRRMQSRLQHLREIYTTTRQNQLNFGHIFRFAFASLEGFHSKIQSEFAALAIEAIYQANDPHAKLETEAEKNRRTENANERYVGIGLSLRAIEDRLVIHSIVPGGPAQRGGVRVNDELIAIDRVRVRGDQIQTLSASLRGILGTRVRLSLRRDRRIHHIELTRADLMLSNVTHSIQVHHSQKIGMIQIRSFFDINLCQSVAEVIQEFEAQNIDGYVLDLRGNRGGFLEQANCLASLFVGRKIVVRVRDLESNKMTSSQGRRIQLTTKPMVILVNEGTASSSEVVASALQDHQRGIVLGIRTFGKGTVQHPRKMKRVLSLEQEVIKWETKERFLSPLGRSIHKNGILPDIQVARDLLSSQIPFFMREAELFPQGPGSIPQTWIHPRVQELHLIGANLLTQARAELRGNSVPTVLRVDSQLYVGLEFLTAFSDFSEQKQSGLKCEQLISFSNSI